MLLRTVSVTAIFAWMAVGFASAQCSDEKATASADKPACCASAKAVAAKSECQEKKTCPASGANCGTASLPKMTFKVGDKTTACCMEAAKLAEGNESSIQYVVAEKTYASKKEALRAYAELLGEHLGTVTTVSYAVGESKVACAKAADELAAKEKGKVRYALASYTFDSKADAEKAAEAAKKAADGVTMKMVVGEKEFCCKKMAADEAAKCETKKVEFVVGETRTEDEAAAQVALAHARVLAALDAVKNAAEKSTRVAQGG